MKRFFWLKKHIPALKLFFAKPRLRLPVITLTVLFFVALPVFAEPLQVGFSLIQGLRTGTYDEYVFSKKDGDYKKLSELNWDFKDIFYMGAELSFYAHNFTATAGGAAFFPKRSGFTQDSDWLELTSMKTNYSVSQNYLEYGGFFNTQATYKIPLGSIFSVHALSDFDFTAFYMKAPNGYGWYGNDSTPYVSWNDENAVYHETLPAVSYLFKSYKLQIGTGVTLKPIKQFSADFFYKIAGLSFYETVDHHYDGNKFYLDSGAQFFSAHTFGGSLTLFLSKKLSASANVSHSFQTRFLAETRSSSEQESNYTNSNEKSAFSNALTDFSLKIEYKL